MTKTLLSVLVVLAFGALLFVLHPSPSLFLLAALLLFPARQFRAMGLALLAAGLLLAPTTAGLHLLGHLLLSNARPVVEALSILVMLAALLFVRPDFASPKRQGGGPLPAVLRKARLPRKARPAAAPVTATPAAPSPAPAVVVTTYAAAAPQVTALSHQPLGHQPSSAAPDIYRAPALNTQPVPVLNTEAAPAPAARPEVLAAPASGQGEVSFPPDC